MEFTKSNRFNDNNENTVNQNLIHYAGKAGEFDYDPNIWEISDDSLKLKNKEVESLPENLELPKGCIDISHMFANCNKLTDITPLQNWDISQVENTSYTFSFCEKLTYISTLNNPDKLYLFLISIKIFLNKFVICSLLYISKFFK